MKKILMYSLIFSFCTLGFYACNEDDEDEQVTPQSNSPAPGSGGGAGTGGGTGSGGIPPNSMRVTIDNNVVNFDSIQGTSSGNDVQIIGRLNASYPRLTIRLTDTLSSDTFFFPGQPGEVTINYESDSNTSYLSNSGFLFLRTIDSSRNLVNGRFEALMRNTNNASDTVVFTSGQFNKFYE